MINDKILSHIEGMQDDMIQMRHYLHETPEISSEEFETSAYLKAIVKDLDLEIEEVPKDENSSGTGFIATLDTGKSGKTIGLRTDIDGLPVTENTNNLSESRDVISKKPGSMHACGHDGHMTILIHTMKTLIDLKDQLNGKIIFIFEEGEEFNTGINAMVRLLKTKDIDAIYGNHLASFLDAGYVAVDAGPVMAASSMIEFDVIGKGGHGSRPDLSINPLYAGVDVLNSISVAWNNQVDVEETVTLGITQFNAGTANNVFADKASIGGTLRYFNDEVGVEAYNMLMNIARNVAAVHKCTIEESDGAGPRLSPVVNDENLANLAQSSVEELYPGRLTHDVKWYASETFAKYEQVAPSVFALVGIKNEEKGIGAEHHSEYFDMDDSALAVGVGSMVKFAVDYLNN